eukprot:9206450-Pyramimonas_sp.AAC.1
MASRLADASDARFRESGDFAEITEAQELPQFKWNPDAFQRLLATAPRKTRALSGIECACVP